MLHIIKFVNESSQIVTKFIKHDKTCLIQTFNQGNKYHRYYYIHCTIHFASMLSNSNCVTFIWQSLMHVLKYRGKVTEPEARYYMKQMVTGVAYIHSQKVVHRDLKPGNMFLSDRMIVKIGDFGLATRLDGQCRRV